jgi:hypothetical protein
MKVNYKTNPHRISSAGKNLRSTLCLLILPIKKKKVKGKGHRAVQMRKKNQAFVDPHSQATSTCMGFI